MSTNTRCFLLITCVLGSMVLSSRVEAWAYILNGHPKTISLGKGQSPRTALGKRIPGHVKGDAYDYISMYQSWGDTIMRNPFLKNTPSPSSPPPPTSTGGNTKPHGIEYYVAKENGNNQWL